MTASVLADEQARELLAKLKSIISKQLEEERWSDFGNRLSPEAQALASQIEDLLPECSPDMIVELGDHGISQHYTPTPRPIILAS